MLRTLLLLILYIGPCSMLLSQDLTKLRAGVVPPQGLLAGRSMVIYHHSFTNKELEQVQQGFQQIGIDAGAYFDASVVFAGRDATLAYTSYFTTRQFNFVIFLTRAGSDYVMTITSFNGKSSLIDEGQGAWQLRNSRLSDLLRNALQDSWSNQRKQNYLINEFPETDIRVDIVKGNRQEFYALDLKVDNLAVVRFGNEQQDKELEEFLKSNYPLKYKVLNSVQDETELQRQGCQYVLCFVKGPGSVLRELLGYPVSENEKSLASITFPAGQLQLKTLPAETEVYKFYFRHIGNGNVFLGTKWDADETWQDALRNHIIGFRTEARIN